MKIILKTLLILIYIGLMVFVFVYLFNLDFDYEFDDDHPVSIIIKIFLVLVMIPPLGIMIGVSLLGIFYAVFMWIPSKIFEFLCELMDDIMCDSITGLHKWDICECRRCGKLRNHNREEFYR